MSRAEKMKAAVIEAEKIAWRKARKSFNIDERQTAADVDAYYRSDLFNDGLSRDRQIDQLIDRANILAEDDDISGLETCHSEFANNVARLLAVAHSIGKPDSDGLSKENKLAVHDALYILSQHENSQMYQVQKGMGTHINPDKLTAIRRHAEAAEHLMKASLNLITMRRQAGLPTTTRVIPRTILT